MNKIVKVVDNRSTAPRTEPFYARADKVIAEWSKSSGWGLAGAEADLAQFDAVLPQAEAVLKDLLLAERPASKQEIVKNLAVLVGCFSNGSMNAEIYSRTLAEYVLDEKPSIGELEYACRYIIRNRTSEFQPTVAVVLGFLAAAKTHHNSIMGQIISITKRERTSYVERIEWHREKERQELQAAEEQRQRRLEKYGKYGMDF